MANVDYPLYKIVIDPESKKTNGFQVGDVVRREYYDHPNLIYSLMVVMETGVDIIGGKDSHYFIGALVEGDAPQNGQLLDFVRITSLLNSQRSGAMYLTASDDQAPYMDVIDGLGLEQSLACPEGLLETPDPRDGTKYGFQSVGKMELRYNKNYEGSERSLTVISREASNIYSKEKWGVRQGIGPCPAYPAKLLISFRSRSSGSTYKDIPLTFGYADDSVIEATKLITVGKDYSYHLFEVSIDYPEQYDRFFSIILTGKLPIGCTLYISELNIVALSDLAALTNGIKVRVGKVKGIVDPVFGTLDGYGAYFQNLYATKNVNIAGTLTAGDEKGFASTFYVGKI
ncbi:hypothetical protein LJC45_06200, partial [Alistipes sp. OttesenSCG-928-B03]|nr:hypothetical protein [Alistipes sp. OttesenSCG-928-B03]